MRIIQAAGWYLPDSIGGTELYVAALSSRLQQAGHQVSVVAPDAESDTARRYVHEGVDTYRFPIAAKVTRAQARGTATVPGAERLHHWFEEMKPDVVHIHTFVTGLGLEALEAARHTGARVIVTTHAASLGFVCERGTLLYRGQTPCDGHVDTVRCARCVLEQRGLPASAAAVLARIPGPWASAAMHLPGRVGTALAMRALIDGNKTSQRRLFELADSVVVLSEWAAAVMRANGAPPAKVVVNRLGVNTSGGQWRHKPVIATTLPVIVGFLGRAESIKGLEDVVRAVISLPAAARLRLDAVVIASSAGERALVERCREMAAHDPRVRLLAPIAPAMVPAFLSAIDVLVCPSRAVEGGPTVALEAHAVGTPVIGAALPALTEYIQDDINGALFPAGDWRQLARCLEAVATDPTTVDRWRARLAPPRTFDDITREYLALYECSRS